MLKISNKTFKPIKKRLRLPFKCDNSLSFEFLSRLLKGLFAYQHHHQMLLFAGFDLIKKFFNYISFSNSWVIEMRKSFSTSLIKRVTSLKNLYDFSKVES